VTGNYKIGCALTADDAHVMAGSKDGKIYVWDLVEVPFCFPAFNFPPVSNKKSLTDEKKKTPTNQGTVVATLEAHAQVVSCLDPCPDATRPNVLISGAADSKAIVWG
jgi:WD40 repeat protein